jgi:hypothetical protein
VVGDGDQEERTDVVYSNNQPGALEYDSEITLLDGLNVKRLAVGVGSGSDIRAGYGLAMIDNTPDPDTGVGPVQVTTTDALTKALLNNPVAGTIVDFGVSVNGVGQGIDASHVLTGPTGFTFGNFVVTGLDPHMGMMNQVSATATVDYDGNRDTIGDQVTIVVTNEVPGTLL